MPGAGPAGTGLWTFCQEVSRCQVKRLNLSTRSMWRWMYQAPKLFLTLDGHWGWVENSVGPGLSSAMLQCMPK